MSTIYMKRFTLSATLLVVFLSAAPVSSFAQNALTALTYNISGAVSDMKNFVGDTSFRGVQIKGSYFQTENLAYGLSAGWQVFDYNTSETISLSEKNVGVDITGFQTRYINALPVMGSVQYFFGESRALRPFVSFGAGVNYVIQRLDIGVSSFKTERFHFAIAPEVGVLIPAGFNSYVILAGRYDHAFKSGSYIGGVEYDFQYWSVKAGIAWEPGF